MVPEQTGFVLPIDAAEIAKCIARLDKDRSELETRSSAALEFARAEFDAVKRALQRRPVNHVAVKLFDALGRAI